MSQNHKIIQQFAALLVSSGVRISSPYDLENWIEDHMRKGDRWEALWDLKEHDVVMLTTDCLREQGVHVGDTGTIVAVYEDTGYAVEFLGRDDRGVQSNMIVVNLNYRQIIKAAQ